MIGNSNQPPKSREISADFDLLSTRTTFRPTPDCKDAGCDAARPPLARHPR